MRTNFNYYIITGLLLVLVSFMFLACSTNQSELVEQTRTTQANTSVPSTQTLQTTQVNRTQTQQPTLTSIPTQITKIADNPVTQSFATLAVSQSTSSDNKTPQISSVRTFSTNQRRPIPQNVLNQLSYGQTGGGEGGDSDKIIYFSTQSPLVVGWPAVLFSRGGEVQTYELTYSDGLKLKTSQNEIILARAGQLTVKAFFKDGRTAEEKFTVGEDPFLEVLPRELEFSKTQRRYNIRYKNLVPGQNELIILYRTAPFEDLANGTAQQYKYYDSWIIIPNNKGEFEEELELPNDNGNAVAYSIAMPSRGSGIGFSDAHDRSFYIPYYMNRNYDPYNQNLPQIKPSGEIPFSLGGFKPKEKVAINVLYGARAYQKCATTGKHQTVLLQANEKGFITTLLREDSTNTCVNKYDVTYVSVYAYGYESNISTYSNFNYEYKNGAVYTSTRNGKDAVYLYDLSQKKENLLSDIGLSCSEGQIASTGSQVIMQCKNVDGNSAVYRVETDGSGFTKLFDGLSPHWFRYEIVYLHTNKSECGGIEQLYKVSSSLGQKPERLTCDNYRKLGPNLGNKGIIYSELKGSTWQLVLLTDLGKSSLKSFPTNMKFPSWSSDNENIIFSTGNEKGIDSQIYKFEIKSGKTTQLTSKGFNGRARFTRNDLIIFHSNRDRQNLRNGDGTPLQTVFIMDFNGNNQQVLISSDEDNWAPDIRG